MRLTLKDHGYPFKKIMHGRKWIGRVVKVAGGGYLGIIGKIDVRAPTEREAFEEVAARYMGHASAEALHSDNARVRQARRLIGKVGARIADELLRGNYEPFDKVMRSPAPVSEAITRAMFRSVLKRP